jgi:DNA-binding MarR family transcriptional regulator
MQLVRQGAAAPAPDEAVDALGDAVVALTRAYRHAVRHEVEAVGSGVSVRELVALIGDGGHRIGELAERRGVGQSVISRQVAELEARGLALRHPDPADGRACLVRLTPAGLRMLTDLGESRRHWLRQTLARHPEYDVRNSARLLATLAEELERRAAQPSPAHDSPHSAGRHVHP